MPLEAVLDHLHDRLRPTWSRVVVVSEGFDVGGIGEVKDSFGHTMFSSSKTTVAQHLVNMLNDRGLPVKGALVAMCREPISVMQCF